MKLVKTTVIILAVFAMTYSLFAYSGDEKEIIKSFENIKLIKIKTLSGDCIVKKGKTNEIEVAVSNNYSPRESCKIKLNKDGETLHLTEKITGTGYGNSSHWTLTVPDNIEIDFFSTSGGLEISNVQGIFSANTASGFYKINNCKGGFNLTTASGNITAYDVVIDDKSSFTSASGNVKVELAESSHDELNVGSASGKATLVYNGNPLRGYFEFSAKKRGGRIESPIGFDNEDIFYKMDQKYVRKSFVIDTDTPMIIIGTSSGKAILVR